MLVASGSGPVFVFCGFCFAVGWLVGLFGHCVGRYAFLTGGSALQPNAWPLFFVLLFLATMSCSVFCRSLDLFLLSFISHHRTKPLSRIGHTRGKRKEDMHQDEVGDIVDDNPWSNAGNKNHCHRLKLILFMHNHCIQGMFSSNVKEVEHIHCSGMSPRFRLLRKRPGKKVRKFGLKLALSMGDLLSSQRTKG